MNKLPAKMLGREKDLNEMPQTIYSCFYILYVKCLQLLLYFGCGIRFCYSTFIFMSALNLS